MWNLLVVQRGEIFMVPTLERCTRMRLIQNLQNLQWQIPTAADRGLCREMESGKFLVWANDFMQ